MIGFLKGEIIDVAEGRILLAIRQGECAVGYSVQVVQGPLSPELSPGIVVELFIHTHVREDALDLYGFLTREERELFLALLTVNGIGPKGAWGILSKVDPATLVRAVLEGDKETLTEIPGIGKKTAERIVLELGDPIRKRIEAGRLSASAQHVGGSARRGAAETGLGAAGPSMLRDAKAALVGLGYREQDVSALLQRLLENPERSSQRVEDLVRSALQQLGQ